MMSIILTILFFFVHPWTFLTLMRDQIKNILFLTSLFFFDKLVIKSPIVRCLWINGTEARFKSMAADSAGNPKKEVVARKLRKLLNLLNANWKVLVELLPRQMSCLVGASLLARKAPLAVMSGRSLGTQARGVLAHQAQGRVTRCGHIHRI